ncbi:MAG: transglutaminase domain-containing protein [Nocardioidaceae bacterium]
MSPKWSRIALEGLALVLAATAVLTPLRASYASNELWVIGLSGALCATLIAAALARASVWVLIPALFMGWLLLAGPFALRSPGFALGVPNGETLADVMTGTFTGWNDLLTTWPWVDVEGPPAMVPFVISYATAAIAASLAFRGRSPGLFALPILLGAAVALSVSQLGNLSDWVPLALAVTLLGWVMLRGLIHADRETMLSGAKNGLITRGVVLLVVLGVASGIAFVITSPDRKDPGLSLRGQVGTLPDTSDFDNPLSRFRTFTKQRLGDKDNVYDKLLFVVEGVPVGSRVRLVALDAYDGRSWYAANDTTPGTTDDRFLRMDTTMARNVKGEDIAGTVKVQRPYKGDWLPTVGAIHSLAFVYTDEDNRRNRLLYNQATDSTVVPIGIGVGNDYDFEGKVPDDKLRRGMKPYPQAMTSIDKGLAEAHFFVRGLGGKGTPMQRVFTIAEYLRSQGHYSSGSEEWESQYLAGQDVKRLFGSFMGAPYVVGDDEQYAAAMALMANAAGVPARVVVGAVLPKSRGIKGKDIQAWVELRIADGSWRVLPREAFTGTKPPPRAYVPNLNIMPPKPKKQDQPQNQPHVKKQQQKKKQRNEESVKRGWIKASVSILLLLLLLLTVPLLKWLRRRRRRRTGSPGDRIAGAWAELLDSARDMGTQAPLGAARPSQAKQLVHAPTGAGLSQSADEASFAEREPTEGQATAYWDRIDVEIAALKKAGSTQRRLLAPFNPVTFFVNRSLR